MSTKFKVAIVGGGVAGLTLALHLEKLEIEFVLLEAYSEIAPQVGASIGLAPNGLKLCQQLGIYEEVKSIGVAGADLVVRDGNSNIIWNHRILEEIRKQHGYDILFMERQQFLKVILGRLQDKTKLLTDQKVSKIEQSKSNVKLHTTGGDIFEADIAIGADGIHSPVRREMWRLAAEAGLHTFGDDPGTDVHTDYGCVFGISDPTGDIKAGDDIQVHKKDRMVGIVCDNEDALWSVSDWFVFFKLPKPHRGLDFPRYTEQEKATLLESEAETLMTDTTKFGQIYEKVRVSTMTALPYHCFDRWHHGRVMTIGDSCHKMSPITGQGGCITLEACAALADELHASLESNNGHLTAQNIDQVFENTEKICKTRADYMVKYSETFQRVVTWANPAYAFIDSYLAPLASTPFIVDQMLKPCNGSYVSKTLPALGAAPELPKLPDVAVLDDKTALRAGNSWWPSWFGQKAKA